MNEVVWRKKIATQARRAVGLWCALMLGAALSHPSAEGADTNAYVPAKGLVLSLWAKEPMVQDPVALNFDDQGRLFVAETARRGTVDIDIRSHPDWLVEDLSNRSIEDLRRFFRNRMSPDQSAANARWLPDYNKDGSHDWRDLKEVKERIRLLEDPGHSGWATRSTLFYEGFHEEVTGVLAGVLPWNGEVFATVYPDLWRLREPARAGGKVSAESVFRGFGVHAAFDGHDLHGLVIGPDGKLYFSHGDNGFVVKTKEGAWIRKPNTGGVFRMNPDGTDLELFASGLRNVQEIAFDEWGNIFGVDNDGDLADERERFVYITEGSDSGWRLHWQFKERGWRKQTHLPDYNPWIQEKMWIPLHERQPAHITPPLLNYSVGPSGFKYHPGTGLNDEYRNSFFLVQFPVQKVTNFKVRPRGAGFEMTEERPLLTGMMASAVTFGPDGALYVADWDGMWNPDGKGAIWKLDDPRVAGSPMRREVERLLMEGQRNRSSVELIGLLGHAHMRIRLRAQFELVRRGEREPLRQRVLDTAGSRLARIHAMWGLGQLKDRRFANSLPFADPDPEIRAQCAKLAGDLHATAVTSRVTALVDDPEPRVQFHAAMALGKIGNEKCLDALVYRLQIADNKDAFLRHACVMALVGIRNGPLLGKLSTHPSSAVRIAAVVALRRMASTEVAAFLEDKDPQVRLEAVRAIHDDDGIASLLPKLAGYLNEPLSGFPEAMVRRAIDAALRLGRPEDADRLLRCAMDSRNADWIRGEALEALTSWDRVPLLDRVEGVVRELSPRSSAAAGLGSSSITLHLPELLQQGSPTVIASLARGVTDNGLKVDPEILEGIYRSSAHKASIRAQALRLIYTANAGRAASLIDESLVSKDLELRLVGLELLASSNPEAFAQQVEHHFAEWGLREQQKALALAGNLKTASLDAFLMSRFQASGGRTEVAKELLLDVRDAIQRRRLPKKSRVGEPDRSVGEKSADTAALLYGGDAVRGEEVFRTHVAAQCVRCHDAGGPGNQAGPLLVGVGARSTREYLLESLLDPSAKIAPGFATVTVELADGDTLDGQIVSEDAKQIVLRTSSGERQTISLSGVKSRHSSQTSSMPPMGEVLTPFEIRDLIEFLASWR